MAGARQTKGLDSRLQNKHTSESHQLDSRPQSKPFSESSLDSETAPRFSPFSHAPIDCHFASSARDFIVKETPLYEPSGSGEHILAHVRKKGLSTFEMLEILSQSLGCKVRDFGYAGLKDKAALTYQYISFHKSLLPALETAREGLEAKQIKFLSLTPHHNKLKIGHLRGNSFFMRLKKVTPQNAARLDSVLELLSHSGFPNYFGAQRFGRDGDNHKSGESLAKGKRLLKNKKLSDFLISSYQSYLFNAWLSMRVQLGVIVRSFSPSEALQALGSSHLKHFNALSKLLSLSDIKALQAQKQPFMLLGGDVMCHYPFGKAFVCEGVDSEVGRFMQRDIAPTGLLCGQKTLRAAKMARELEKMSDDISVRALGSRRYAWVWAQDIQSQYFPEKAHYELCFCLPKGSYATIFLEMLLNSAPSGAMGDGHF